MHLACIKLRPQVGDMRNATCLFAGFVLFTFVFSITAPNPIFLRYQLPYWHYSIKGPCSNQHRSASSVF